MPLTPASPNSARPRVGKRTLQRLRREAGYRSAKDFAEKLGIPGTIYAHYERAVEGPECGIPLPSAWQIADALGCSIDLVVGREDIDVRDAGSLDKRVTALSPTNQTMLTGFLDYLESLEAAGSRRQAM